LRSTKQSAVFRQKCAPIRGPRVPSRSRHNIRVEPAGSIDIIVEIVSMGLRRNTRRQATPTDTDVEAIDMFNVFVEKGILPPAANHQPAEKFCQGRLALLLH